MSAKQILLIHSMVVDETGGSHGLRDEHALLSLEGLPRQNVFGQELYPNLFDKASVYLRNIAMNHPFVDGNKRTALTSASIFLENNGYKLSANEKDMENIILIVVKEKLEIHDIASWLKKHSKKI